jgi:hypothetical protein
MTVDIDGHVDSIVKIIPQELNYDADNSVYAYLYAHFITCIAS